MLASRESNKILPPRHLFPRKMASLLRSLLDLRALDQSSSVSNASPNVVAPPPATTCTPSSSAHACLLGSSESLLSAPPAPLDLSLRLSSLPSAASVSEATNDARQASDALLGLASSPPRQALSRPYGHKRGAAATGMPWDDSDSASPKLAARRPSLPRPHPGAKRKSTASPASILSEEPEAALTTAEVFRRRVNVNVSYRSRSVSIRNVRFYLVLLRPGASLTLI